MNDEYERRRDAYRRKAETDAPPPWRRVPVHVSGVTAIGFGEGTDLLLVLTHSGLGVIDATTGEVVARQGDTDTDALFDENFPIYAPGIGPLCGRRVSLAGLWGGGLRSFTPDGWSVHRIAPNWPTECAVLSPPETPELDDESSVTMLAKDLDPEIRALGFSDTGRSLAIANTALFLWHRD